MKLNNWTVLNSLAYCSKLIFRLTIWLCTCYRRWVQTSALNCDEKQLNCKWRQQVLSCLQSKGYLCCRLLFRLQLLRAYAQNGDSLLSLHRQLFHFYMPRVNLSSESVILSNLSVYRASIRIYGVQLGTFQVLSRCLPMSVESEGYE